MKGIAVTVGENGRRDFVWRGGASYFASSPLRMMGRDLFRKTGNGTTRLRVTTKHPGTSSPTACGGRSNYEVTWTIKPL